MESGQKDLIAANMPVRRAAMYVRMSTDHQKYSTENQADAIREYAARRNIEIVKTYQDAGKSGLKLDGRDALQSLITDVQSVSADYSVILVLDVTRWGRFQDADESAYYEYICRRAGIDVQYVAEQFENDGSPVSTIVKGVKRAMAGEYSRELSAKVFAGQCRLIELGFKQGGTAGYGMRRVLVDEHRQFKAELKFKEHKSLQTDRVILMPGPVEEIENVRWVYDAFVNEGLNENDIADRLNARGLLTDLSRPFTRGVVHGILTNEKYIGNNVFNRRSFKLKKRHVENPPDMWVRNDGAFEGIIEPRMFYAAQGIILQRSRRFSNEEMLTRLKALYERQGWLSGILIDEAEDMPPSSAYTSRFGGLYQAYTLIGYDPGRDRRYIEDNRYIRQMHPEIIDQVTRKIVDLGGRVRHDEATDFLVINDEIKVSLVISRCFQTTNERNRWKIQFDAGLLPDITIAVRLDSSNRQVLDYYLIPALDVEDPQLRLADENRFAIDAYRFDDLESFFVLTERQKLPEAA